MRGRVAGRLVHLPGARGRSRPPRRGPGRGRARAGRTCRSRPPAALGPAPQRRLRARRSGARPRSAAAGRSRGRRRVRCSWRGWIHSSQPVRAWIAAACPQWSMWAWVQTSSRTCSSRSPTWSSARSRCAIEPRVCMPAVDEHDPVAGGERPGVAVRHAGPGERQPQPPDARAPRARRARPPSAEWASASPRTVPLRDGRRRPLRRHRVLRRARAPRPAGRGRLLGARRRRRAGRPGRPSRARTACGSSSAGCSPRCPTSRWPSRTWSPSGDRVAVLWRASGTFAGDSDYQGIRPTGGRVELARAGPVHRPRRADRRERRVPGRARLRPPDRHAARAGDGRRGGGAARLQREDPGGAQVRRHAAEPVADGVWRVRGGVPRAMNVYLIEDDGGGVTVFDAGIKGMGPAIAAAASRARRHQPRRARPQPRRPPRRRARAARARLLPRRRPRAGGGRRRPALRRLRQAAGLRAAVLPPDPATSGTAGR